MLTLVVLEGDKIFFVCVLGCFSWVRLFVASWTVAHQTRPSIGFSRQEYWSGLPCPPLGDLPDPEIEPLSLTSPELVDRFLTTNTIWEALNKISYSSFILVPGIRPVMN